MRPLVAVLTTILFVAAGADAARACPAPNTSRPFVLFLDFASYYPVPGGTFESGLEWDSSGPASVVEGNETFYANDPSDHRSLRLGRGGVVTSTPFCISADTPKLRFYARAGLLSDPLWVDVRRLDADGEVVSVQSTQLSSLLHAVWLPGPEVELDTDGLENGSTGVVELRFRSRGTWWIDDVLIDPYKRG